MTRTKTLRIEPRKKGWAITLSGRWIYSFKGMRECLAFVEGFTGRTDLIDLYESGKRYPYSYKVKLSIDGDLAKCENVK